MNVIKEVWKDIDVFDIVEGYEISNYGRIKNLNGKIRKTTKNSDGYLKTNFRTYHKGLKTFTVHRLVANIFIGEKEDGFEIDHIDGNKENNFFLNLEYVDHDENMRRAFENGLIKDINSCGELNVKAKLSEKDVLLIRKMYASGFFTQKELARKFGIDQTQISCIVLRKNWRHI